MNVYIVVSCDVTDEGAVNEVEKVFSTYEKAKAYFDDRVIGLRKTFEDDKYFVIEESEGSFEAYEDGFANRNSYYIEIKEMPVE